MNHNSKINLRDLRDLHGLETETLARAANLPLDTVYAIIRHIPVGRLEAQQVVEGLSRLTGHAYTLENVDILLLPETEDIA